jgi:uncharacterized protein
MTISTPCIKICQIDHITGLCVGCGRTREEIGLWGSFPESHRQALMKEFPDRLKSAWKNRARGARRSREIV